MTSPGPRRALRSWPLLILVAGACATSSGGGWSDGEASAPEILADGVRAMVARDYSQASERLWPLALWCEAGDHGRRAVLLLATAALDPRNPQSDADEAARLAARYLEIPGIGSEDRILAETLYLMALDRGGSAGGPASVEREPALRFGDCGAGAPRRAEAEPRETEEVLPTLPDAPAPDVLRRARAQRDSLRERVTELEAELERIREVLRQGISPDTLGLPPR